MNKLKQRGFRALLPRQHIFLVSGKPQNVAIVPIMRVDAEEELEQWNSVQETRIIEGTYFILSTFHKCFVQTNVGRS